MSKRASNLERPTAWDRAHTKAQRVDKFLIDEGMLCPFCLDLECVGRGEKIECTLWPAHVAKDNTKDLLDNIENSA